MLSALFTQGGPWAIWFFALLAVCGILYYRNATVQQVCKYTPTRQPPRGPSLPIPGPRLTLFYPTPPPYHYPTQTVTTEEFKKFQNLYLVVFLTMMMAGA